MSNVQQLNQTVLASVVHLFDIAKTRFSKNWGKQQPYKKIKDPELPVTFYAGNVGKAVWKIHMKDSGLLLNSGTLDCNKGLNLFVYTLDIAESQLKKYEEALRSTQKDTKKTVEIEKSDSGKHYLRKGSYTFTIEKDATTVTKDFVVE